MKLQINQGQCGYDDSNILSDINITINSGEFLSILGPNGVGKTTLFKTLLGLLPLQSGKISLDGYDISEFSAAEIAHQIAYVPQAHTPPFPYSVLDVVVMGRCSHISLFNMPQAQDYQRAHASLAQLGASALADRTYTELSGGEQQMVLIARALTQEPALLILDEPTANLDYGNQIRVLTQLKRLVASGIGVVMTTHSPDHTFLCGGRVVLLRPKQTLIQGDVTQVVTAQNLRQAYGVDVGIEQIQHQDHALTVCFPLINGDQHTQQRAS